MRSNEYVMKEIREFTFNKLHILDVDKSEKSYQCFDCGYIILLITKEDRLMQIFINLTEDTQLSPENMLYSLTLDTK